MMLVRNRPKSGYGQVRSLNESRAGSKLMIESYLDRLFCSVRGVSRYFGHHAKVQLSCWWLRYDVPAFAAGGDIRVAQGSNIRRINRLVSSGRARCDERPTWA